MYILHMRRLAGREAHNFTHLAI